MTDATAAPSPEELEERIGKLNEHIAEFEAKVDLWDGESKGHFATVVAELKDDRDVAVASARRVSETAGEEWHKVADRTTRAFERLETELQAAWADFEGELADDVDTYKAAAQRQLESWRGHVDQMRLQAKLGEMEARDALDELEHAYEAARPHLEQAKDSADEGFGSLRERGREVLEHLRAAARAASRKMQ
jgi:molybdenum-dependent DNA-binding transcriptional regulator ModE